MKKIIPLVSILAMTAAMPAFAHDDGHMGDTYFKQMDTNGDGYISKDEFMAHAQKKFDEMDANHDGKISKQEWINYKKTHDEHMHHHAANHTGGINRPDEMSGAPDTSEDAKSNAESSDNH